MTRTGTYTAGLIIFIALGVLDVVGVVGLATDDVPPAVAVTGAVLGLATLAGARPAWRGGRGGLVTVVVSRLLSVLLGVPAFFIDDTPGWARIGVAIGILLTVVGLGLVVQVLRHPRLSPTVPDAPRA
jgi:hypothetical protein